MVGNGIALVLVIGSFALYPMMGKEFLPEFNEGIGHINVLSAPGTSLKQSDRIGEIAEKLCSPSPEVISTGRRTGRAELDEHAEGVHYTEIDVDFRKSNERASKSSTTCATNSAKSPAWFQRGPADFAPTGSFAFRRARANRREDFFRRELEALRAAAAEVEGQMKTVEGIVGLQIEKQVLMPQVRIQPDREKAKLYGIKWANSTSCSKPRAQRSNGRPGARRPEDLRCVCPLRRSVAQPR